MLYKFDKELCLLIVEIRGIRKDLLSMQLELFRSYPSVAAVPSINYLVMDCILQANEIQHDLLDLRLAIMMERDLSSLIHPTMLPGQATMSTSSCSDASPALSSTGTSDYDPLTLPPFLSPLELQNLCKSADDVTKLEILATPHPQLYQRIAHFQALDQTIQCLEHLVQKEQEELHKVFLVLEVEGITQVLAPLIICKRTKRYKPYRVYCHH